MDIKLFFAIKCSMHPIWELLENAKTSSYIGEAISQYEHALQCADLALKSGADSELIIAALLHDIGHFCPGTEHASSMGSWGVMAHEKVGGNFLRGLGFSERIVELVESHVDAKRYFVATNPSYFAKLSQASQATLQFQGGPMTADEAKVFSQKKIFKDVLQLRMWDEQAKELNYNYPPIEIFQNLLKQMRS